MATLRANLRIFMICRVVGLCEWDKLWWLWQRAEVEEKVDDRGMIIENNRYITVSVMSILINRKSLVKVRRKRSVRVA